MARIPFVDTHFHLFDLQHPTLRYVWLTPESQDPELGNMDAITSLRYWAEDYIAETRFANVAKSIHVQAAFKAEPHIGKLVADRAKFLGEAQWCFAAEHTVLDPAATR